MSEMHWSDSGVWQENAMDATAYNKNALEELAWAIEASVGQFKLFLVRCNYTSLRSHLIESLRELTNVNIRILEVEKSEKAFYGKIYMEVREEQPSALMVFGLESVDDLDRLLTTTNQVREEFRKNFDFPLILWINDEVLKKLMQLAPDFESWAITTDFVIATSELIDFIKQIAQQFFEGNLILDIEATQEIKLACNDLQGRESVLDLELRAIIEFLLGEVKYVESKIDIALEHYQKSLDLWQKNNNLERQIKVLIDIAFCYYVKTPRYRRTNHSNLQATKHYVQLAFDIFQQLEKPNLSTRSLLKFGDILQDLQKWQQLQIFAQKSLQHHQYQDKSIDLAIDYGFLAEVALAQKRWNDAYQLAKKALDQLSISFKIQTFNNAKDAYELDDKKSFLIDHSRYLFILAKAQQYLGQSQEAVSNLEEARGVGKPEENPCLYLDILNHLQKLYFEHRQYIKAFEIKLERQSVEQQYGFRAFVGAGRIQPQRQAELALTQVETQENVALEITASGRLLDVEHLVERIGRNDYKLIVIHGQSGVGKSSLVNGGLLPALKQKAIGTHDALPVLMRVYTSWVAELGQLLAVALEKNGIQLTAPLDSTVAILAQIQQSESRNLRTILIFDQFEEFFFVYPAPAERRRFFEFLGECLKILPVKIILSLREDYLHYLLECNRLPSMAIISNDILSKNVLYPLGNFSYADAKSIIQQLTQRSNFHLEPGLIDELVQDLAGELGEVRPIELQVVGAQLQTDNITTLAQYRERGPKNELVKRYLAEVIGDCGAENKQAAELVLYLFTDEKGTRPLKTRAEVERDLQALSSADSTAEVSTLNLVLKIFVDSGLVVILPELPADRYQLVHDYLAAFIRQQQEPKLNELIAELEKEREHRQKAEEQRKLIKEQLEQAEQAKQRLEAKLQEVRKDLVAAAAERNSINRAVQEAQLKLQEAEAAFEKAIAGTELELTGIRVLRQFEFSQIEALLAAMHAGQKLKGQIKNGCPFDKYPALSPLLALQQILNNIQEKNRFLGHQGGIRSVSFSFNGQYLATASDDGTARLWDSQGNQLMVFQGHDAMVRSVSFSPDDRRLATTSSDCTARLWDLQGNQLVVFEGHKLEVRNVSFSPDGQYLATASGDCTARLWDLQGNQLMIFQGHQGRIHSISFNPDGQRLATASSDRTARLWDLQGNQLMVFQGHQDWVISACFNSDGQYLATASGDCTARVWDLQGNQLMIFQGHQGWVNSVSFSPDRQYLATASDDGTARLWDLQSNRLTVFQGHLDWVYSVSFSPDGHYLATSSNDCTARLWDLQGNQLALLQGHQSRVNSVSFSPNGQYLVTASDDGTVILWNLKGNQLAQFQAHKGRVIAISFSPGGQYLATASGDRTTRLWDLQGNQLAELQGHYSWVSSVSFSSNGQYLATASGDRTARLWDLQGNQLAELQGHQGEVWCISFSPDGQYLATASSDCTARLWDLQGKQLVEFQGHQAGVWSVSFSPDGQYLATASSDRTAKVWDLQGNQLVEFQGHQGVVWSVSFSPDGQYLATTSSDRTARLWRVENLEQLLVRGYNWLRDYLATNTNVSESDRHLCDEIDNC
ncbi:hypothetical protein [Nostoc sp. UHCC 0251]|uniref:nSTAND1 domain-containing NTPase n=1 Tax=Nostoc sp. UHCC 0251 TaxID=3110240 RepID=UPI002B20AD94|nr:hypothetical protein [Nostoc sp. UHCC 0251]MEA5627190.1 hypothetical protein [Nostoc sp. UHCC 0251]